VPHPIDPETFSVVLNRTIDGKVTGDPVNVTADFNDPVIDAHQTHIWTGSIEIPEYGEHRLDFSVSNGLGEGTGDRTFHLVPPVETFAGGFFIMKVSKLSQDPADCLVPNGLLGIILGMINKTEIPVILPAASAMPADVTIGLPLPLGNTEVTVSLDEENNSILMAPKGTMTIDISPYISMLPIPIPGYDCIITASAGGAFDKVNSDDLDGYLDISDFSIEAAAGGTCTLDPGDTCKMIVEMDANPGS